MTREAHNQAIQALIQDPSNPALAEAVVNLALSDPENAVATHEAVAPTPLSPPLTLEGLEDRYDRHNLHMPQAPKRVEFPGSLQDLVADLQRAVDAWDPVKAIGDGYGFSNAGFTPGSLFVTAKHLNRVLDVEASVLRDPSLATRLCCFESGATIETLNDHLEKRSPSAALWNQPGYEKLTFVGTMLSGGHGSGTWLGPLSSQVRSIHLLTVKRTPRRVVQLRIEPTNGITDRGRFKAEHPDVELLQDDDVFNACTVSVGCLGIIYSVTIDVRPGYNILETRKMMGWSTVREQLPELIARQGKDLHSIEVWVNPYPVPYERDGETYHCVLGTRQETHAPPKGMRGIGIRLGGSAVVGSIIAWWAHNHPESVPGLIHSGLKSTQAEDVILTARDGLNFGGPNEMPVDAAACGVPADRTVEAVDGLLNLLRQRAKEQSAWITSPVGVRFVKGAEAHLSPQFGRDTCMIELPTFLGTDKARETLRAFHDFLFENFNGRPHWGQINDMPGARLTTLFPKLDKFLRSYRVLNPGGFFDNAFTQQMGFRQ